MQSDTRCRAQWYVYRKGQYATPLIALDELPEGFEVEGLSRMMTMNDVRNMECLGELDPVSTFHKLIDTSTERQKKTVSFDSSADAAYRNGGGVLVPSHTTPAPPEPSAARSVQHSTEPYEFARSQRFSDFAARRKQSWRSQQDTPSTEQRQSQAVPSKMLVPKDIIIEEVVLKQGTESEPLGSVQPAPSLAVGIHRRLLPPSGREPDQGRKRYCTHWIRTGECDYTQQGCLYIHEMPDKATLEAIGFRTVPRWWQEHIADRRDEARNLMTTVKFGSVKGRPRRIMGVGLMESIHAPTKVDELNPTPQAPRNGQRKLLPKAKAKYGHGANLPAKASAATIHSSSSATSDSAADDSSATEGLPAGKDGDVSSRKMADELDLLSFDDDEDVGVEASHRTPWQVVENRPAPGSMAAQRLEAERAKARKKSEMRVVSQLGEPSRDGTAHGMNSCKPDKARKNMRKSSKSDRC